MQDNKKSKHTYNTYYSLCPCYCCSCTHILSVRSIEHIPRVKKLKIARSQNIPVVIPGYRFLSGDVRFVPRNSQPLTKFLSNFKYTPAAVNVLAQSIDFDRNWLGRLITCSGFGHSGPNDPLARSCDSMVGN